MSRDINPIEDIKSIRNMMERSTKFLSLSGLSGISAGIIALIGTYLAYSEVNKFKLLGQSYYLSGGIQLKYEELTNNLLLIALIVLVSALSVGFLFTYLKASKNGHTLIHPTAFKVLWSILIPLSFGGVFTLLIYWHGAFELVAPASLIFYGLALYNGSKYLNNEIKYLAITELLLGLLADIFLHQSLIFWAIGFGFMHIIYGSIMYFKYDRN